MQPMQEWETYRLYAIHRGTLKWFEETREAVLGLGKQGWGLVSATALEKEDGGLLEILWFKRPIIAGAIPPPEPKWLGFVWPNEEGQSPTCGAATVSRLSGRM